MKVRQVVWCGKFCRESVHHKRNCEWMNLRRFLIRRRKRPLRPANEQIDKPLIEDVSADVAPVVQEFIAEATQANAEQDIAIAAEEPAFERERRGALSLVRRRRLRRISRLST